VSIVCIWKCFGHNNRQSSIGNGTNGSQDHYTNKICFTILFWFENILDFMKSLLEIIKLHFQKQISNESWFAYLTNHPIDQVRLFNMMKLKFKYILLRKIIILLKWCIHKMYINILENVCRYNNDDWTNNLIIPNNL